MKAFEEFVFSVPADNSTVPVESIDEESVIVELTLNFAPLAIVSVVFAGIVPDPLTSRVPAFITVAPV